MSKDVRIEVIYYKTPADVSLEFGLHGNYPLRLLSERCDDKNSFFHSLKRAVSRSEIIITVGGYNEKLPKFIAKAIGKNSFVPDYKKQNIDADEPYSIPESSEILTTKFSNRFGGFIIECGPQTIISLTDDKFTRISIVKDFIVNYITEHHKVFSFLPTAISTSSIIEVPEKENISKPLASETSDTFEPGTFEPNYENEVSDENTIITTDDETIDNNTIAIQETADVIFDLKETKVDKPEPDLVIPLTNETDTVISDGSEPPIQLDKLLNIDNLDFFEDKTNRKIQKVHHRRRKLRILCIILSLLVILVSIACALLPVYDKPIFGRYDYYSQLIQTYNSNKNNLSASFKDVLEINPDFFVWLRFDDANINHPVLTVKSEDEINEYLHCLPNGKSDSNGTLVTLADGSIVNNPNNTVIYGSAAEGGLLETFSLISPNYKDQYISTADSDYYANWQIFATFTDSEAKGFNYSQTEFSSKVEYLNFLERLSYFSSNATNDFSGIEKLLTIIAEKGEQRYITVAVLRSMLILSPPTIEETVSNNSDLISLDSTSSATENSESEFENTENNDYLGETPDFILPELPSVPVKPTESVTTPSNSSAQSSTSRSEPASSSNSSETSNSSSSTNNSTPSSTSSENNSAKPSDPSYASSNPSNMVVSSSQISSSSLASSTVSQPISPNPDINPIYTWDVYLAVKSNNTGTVIIGDAVSIVAMVIEIEMSPTIDPPEALIAQAVVKYNWIINNNGLCTVNENGEIIPPTKPPTNAIDTNPTPQALKYAAEAKGMVLMYGNTLAKTYCHSYSAGYTAAYHNIWGGGNYPYLQGVNCSVDSTYKNFETVTKYSAETVKNLIKNELNVDVSPMPKTDWIKPLTYDNNNTYCVTVSVGGIEKKGTYLRDSFFTSKNGVSTIRSSAYKIDYNAETDEFIVTVRGHGHGVGLSQYGAKQYAKQGWNCEKILYHFFPGTKLVIN